MEFKFESAGLTDRGKRRKSNQDTILNNPKIGLYIVADGMGGKFGGEIASKIAVQTIEKVYCEGALSNRAKEWSQSESIADEINLRVNLLKKGINIANSNIYMDAQNNPAYQGMGTTIALLAIVKSAAIVAHAGDSRVYRLNTGVMKQLTKDHSFINEGNNGQPISPELARNSPFRHIITRAIGPDKIVKPDFSQENLASGNIYLLSSDGLTNMLSDKRISEIISSHCTDLSSACQQLIDESNEKGGNDNISCILVKAT